MASGGIIARVAAHRRVFQDAATVGVLTSLTKIAAAVKVLVTARYFGASDDLDAFLIAFLLPTLVVETVAGTFTPSIIPSLIRSQNYGFDRTNRLAQAGLALVLGGLSVLTVVLAATDRLLLPLLGASFSPEKLQLTHGLFLSMILWIPLSAASACWRAVLNAHGQVGLATAVYLSAPVITIGMLVAGVGTWGIWVLAAAQMLGVLLECAVLAVGVKRLGYSLTPRWLGWTPEILAVRGQHWPMLIGTLITAGCALVDQAVAGALGSGTVSALSYGIKLSGVLIAVGGTGMATAVLPEFSRLISEGRWDALRHSVRVHVGVAMAVMTPVTLLLAIGSDEIVRLIYQGGRFSEKDAVLVADVQQYALLMVPFAVALLIGQRLATALGAAELVLRAGILSMTVNIAGDWMLPRWMGVGGIALASTLAHATFMFGLGAMLAYREPRLYRRVPR